MVSHLTPLGYDSPKFQGYHQVLGGHAKTWYASPPLLMNHFAFSTVTVSLFSPGYIGEFEIVDDHRSGKIIVQLTGRINKCGVISPRFDLKLGDVEKWINNLLPSRQFGHIVLTTSAGIVDHEEARRKHTVGKVLGFFY